MEKWLRLKKYFLMCVKNLRSFHIILPTIIFVGKNISYAEKERSTKSINLAMKLYPKAPRFLWLIFDIAMEKHDYDKAAQALKEILELYPNEVSALSSMVELNYLRGEWDELSIAEKKINQSPRYISEGMRTKLNLIRQWR